MRIDPFVRARYIQQREDTPLSVVCRRDGFRTASRRFLNEREEKENKRVCLYFLAYKHICLVISYSNRSMSKLKTNASEIVLEYQTTQLYLAMIFVESLLKK